MRPTMLFLAGIAALIAFGDVATARDGCGRGWFYNGVRCVPQDDDDRYDRGPPRRPHPDSNFEKRRDNPNPDCYNVGGRRICCPRRWTVQDGVCKPYTGR